ncbi:hypothetical protein B0J12DRAFT_646924 [Macrophomina phaseolina]|uniref:TPX2 C-terminal domain-containing protein n=1 Tax=Macrophomina phaseolina TaxID=35725 RepID=A0ABQ8GNR7_9PEZI|nr:hypothetical protein B0J12DRAFT_646924 [Macrophomina phaseolina]
MTTDGAAVEDAAAPAEEKDRGVKNAKPNGKKRANNQAEEDDAEEQEAEDDQPETGETVLAEIEDAATTDVQISVEVPLVEATEVLPKDIKPVIEDVQAPVEEAYTDVDGTEQVQVNTKQQSQPDADNARPDEDEQQVEPVPFIDPGEQAFGSIESLDTQVTETTAIEQAPGETESPGTSPELAPVEQEILEQALMDPEIEKPTVGTPQTSGSPQIPGDMPPLKLEDSIEALDALEDALEEVDKVLESPAAARRASQEKQSAPKVKATTAAATNPKISARPSSNVKAPVKRASTVPSTKSAAKPAPKPAAPVAKAPTRSATVPTATARPLHVRSASTRVAPVKEDSAAGGKQRPTSQVVDYLAMKRRPVSMSFPTPPPPPKSTKQPTVSTFQLPGEAIAAKLKAQKEERLQREAEKAKEGQNKRELSEKEVAEKKKREFKARPVPSFIKNPAAAAQVRQTAASRAREGLMHGGAGPKDGAHKRVSSMRFEPPAGTKRQSTMDAKRNLDLPARPVQRSSSASSSVSGTQQRAASSQSSLASSVSSTTAAALNTAAAKSTAAAAAAAKSRAPSTTSSNGPHPPTATTFSFRPGPITKSEVTAADKQALKQKGKAIFNRDKLEKERMEQERREKEEAAKKARAAAAERGRLASREWAEKMMKRKMEAKAAAKPATA